MNKILASPNIGFADSEYKSFLMSEDTTLTLFLNSWDARSLRIVFSHAIQFYYRLGSFPKELYEQQGSFPFLEEAIFQIYGYKTLDHPFKFFQLEDIDDFPFIQVVAESVIVFKD